MNVKLRLIIMNFLQFAVWGAYLTSMGSYLVSINQASHIGMYYAMQGIVSLFMPAILGIIADRWIPAQKLLSLSHFLAASFMAAAGYYGMSYGTNVEFPILFYTIFAKCSFLYADISPFQLRCIYRTRQSKIGHYKKFPSHPDFRYNRLHLLYVDSRSFGIARHIRTILCMCPYRCCICIIRSDPACLSDK